MQNKQHKCTDNYFNGCENGLNKGLETWNRASIEKSWLKIQSFEVAASLGAGSYSGDPILQPIFNEYNKCSFPLRVLLELSGAMEGSTLALSSSLCECIHGARECPDRADLLEGLQAFRTYIASTTKKRGNLRHGSQDLHQPQQQPTPQRHWQQPQQDVEDEDHEASPPQLPGLDPGDAVALMEKTGMITWDYEQGMVYHPSRSGPGNKDHLLLSACITLEIKDNNRHTLRFTNSLIPQKASNYLLQHWVTWHDRILVLSLAQTVSLAQEDADGGRTVGKSAAGIKRNKDGYQREALDVLSKGIVVFGRLYRMLAFKQETGKVYMYAERSFCNEPHQFVPLTAEEARFILGSTNTDPLPGKVAARLEHYLTPSCRLPGVDPGRVFYCKDIKASDGSAHTDGVGLISPDLAHGLGLVESGLLLDDLDRKPFQAQYLKTAQYGAVMQVRIHDHRLQPSILAKGCLVVCAALPQRTVIITMSMVKEPCKGFALHKTANVVVNSLDDEDDRLGSVFVEDPGMTQLINTPKLGQQYSLALGTLYTINKDLTRHTKAILGKFTQPESVLVNSSIFKALPEGIQKNAACIRGAVTAGSAAGVGAGGGGEGQPRDSGDGGGNATLLGVQCCGVPGTVDVMVKSNDFKASDVSLNRELAMLLVHRGVPESIFTRMLKDHMDLEPLIGTDVEATIAAANMMGFKTFAACLEAGFGRSRFDVNTIDKPNFFTTSETHRLREKYCEQLTQLRLAVPPDMAVRLVGVSAFAFNVGGITCSLPEASAVIVKDGIPENKTYLAAVYRNPGLHPKDIQLVTITAPPPWFQQAFCDGKEGKFRTNAIYFSAEGRNVAADMASGDFDGDTYLVIQDPDIVSAIQSQHAAKQAEKQAAKEQDKKQKRRKVDLSLCHSTEPTDPPPSHTDTAQHKPQSFMPSHNGPCRSIAAQLDVPQGAFTGAVHQSQDDQQDSFYDCNDDGAHFHDCDDYDNDDDRPAHFVEAAQRGGHTIGGDSVAVVVANTRQISTNGSSKGDALNRDQDKASSPAGGPSCDPSHTDTCRKRQVKDSFQHFFFGKPGEQQRTQLDALACWLLQKEQVTTEILADLFLNSKEARDMIGVAHNTWMMVADQLGPGHKDARALARLYGQALDAGKKGGQVNRDQVMENKNKLPNWLQGRSLQASDRYAFIGKVDKWIHRDMSPDTTYMEEFQADKKENEEGQQQQKKKTRRPDAGRGVLTRLMCMVQPTSRLSWNDMPCPRFTSDAQLVELYHMLCAEDKLLLTPELQRREQECRMRLSCRNQRFRTVYFPEKAALQADEGKTKWQIEHSDDRHDDNQSDAMATALKPLAQYANQPLAEYLNMPGAGQQYDKERKLRVLAMYMLCLKEAEKKVKQDMRKPEESRRYPNPMSIHPLSPVLLDPAAGPELLYMKAYEFYGGHITKEFKVLCSAAYDDGCDLLDGCDQV